MFEIMELCANKATFKKMDIINLFTTPRYMVIFEYGFSYMKVIISDCV